MFEIFQFEFIQRAFVVGTIVAILAPLIGIFIVVRRYSALADSLSHVSLVGVAIGLVSNTSPLITATITTAISGIFIENLRQAQKKFSESILVLFTTGSMGLATIIASVNNSFNVSLDSFLFGSIATISKLDFYLILLVFFITTILFILKFNQFFLISFDEEIAKTSGLSAKVLNYVLVVLAGLIISISIRTIGVLLISSLMIVPVISSLQLKLNFKSSILSSVGIAVATVWVGLILAYLLNFPSGGTISVLNLMIYLAIYLWMKLE